MPIAARSARARSSGFWLVGRWSAGSSRSRAARQGARGVVDGAGQQARQQFRPRRLTAQRGGVRRVRLRQQGGELGIDGLGYRHQRRCPRTRGQVLVGDGGQDRALCQVHKRGDGVAALARLVGEMRCAAAGIGLGHPPDDDADQFVDLLGQPRHRRGGAQEPGGPGVVGDPLRQRVALLGDLACQGPGAAVLADGQPRAPPLAVLGLRVPAGRLRTQSRQRGVGATPGDDVRHLGHRATASRSRAVSASMWPGAMRPASASMARRARQ